MICIDSNILIYAFNRASAFHTQAKRFIEQQIQQKSIAICDISLIEFYQVITDSRKLSVALTTTQAQSIVETIINNGEFLVLYLNDKIVSSSFQTVDKYNIKRFDIYDHFIAHTCNHYKINQFCTSNIDDFKKYPFLTLVKI